MPQLLLVDDEPDIRHLYADELRDEGYEVKTAGSGSEAAELLAMFDFDLLILDIQLNKESGLEILQKVARERVETPVILCTAFTSYRDDFSSWLADAYVVKSADISELKREIRKLLDRKRAH